MYTEVPVLRRCCCCLPVRYGLIAWGYIKLIMLLVSLIYSFVPLLFVLRAYGNQHIYKDLAIIATVMLMLIVDITMHVIFVIGAHKKNVKLLNVYYYYSLALLVLLGILNLVYIGLLIGSQFHYISMIDLIGRTAILTLLLVIQAYIILLVRSEIIKLKDAGSCRFENNAADAECVLNVEDGNEEKAIFDDNSINKK